MDNPILDYSFDAAADLSAKQYYLVKLSSSGVSVANAAGDPVVGALQNKPESGQTAQVRLSGITKVLAGGVVAVGDRVKASAAGKGVAAQAAYTNTSDAGAAQDALVGSYVVGRALTAAVDGEYFSMLITHEGAVPTTVA